MRISLNNIVEQVVAALMVATVSGIISLVKTDKINFIVIAIGFLLGFLCAIVIVKFSGMSLAELLSISLGKFLMPISGVSVTGSQLAHMVWGQSSMDKVNTIMQVAPRVRHNLTAEEVNDIMFGAVSRDKVTILEILSPKIQRPLCEGDIDTILFGMSSSHRSKASEILSRY